MQFQGKSDGYAMRFMRVLLQVVQQRALHLMSKSDSIEAKD